jgi:hypothetical protein
MGSCNKRSRHKSRPDRHQYFLVHCVIPFSAFSAVTNG